MYLQKKTQTPVIKQKIMKNQIDKKQFVQMMILIHNLKIIFIKNNRLIVQISFKSMIKKWLYIKNPCFLKHFNLQN